MTDDPTTGDGEARPPARELPSGPEDALEGILDDEDGPVFDAPWQARAFGLAVALHDEAAFDWGEFQRRLVAEVEATTPEDFDAEAAARDGADGADEVLEGVYYEQWLDALERLLVEDGVLDPDDVEARAAAFADGERTAEEFVEGEREH